MEGGDGIVAVVRGPQDATVAVTLLDGCRRYTLMANSVTHPPIPSCIHVTRDMTHGHETPTTRAVCNTPAPASRQRCDSSVQATDGQYTTVYKMSHCSESPTSPPVLLSEFPPQRAELYPGHGNFLVGGFGSGEKYRSVRPTTQLKGGMSWPDRGSVCAPRLSKELDSFANSLRRYPTMSPQRSSEIVERLINYTQTKYTSSPSRNRMSPSRMSECFSNQTYERGSKVLTTQQNRYEPLVNIRPRVKADESPTRQGRPKRCDIPSELNTSTFGRNFEVRCLRDISKSTRESPRNLTVQNNTSANMEIQAVVETTSKEVATSPQEEPSKRNVAIPRLPASIITQSLPEAPLKNSAFKSVQTMATHSQTKALKSVQATSSSIELISGWPLSRRPHNKHSRKSRSQEELYARRHDFRKQMLQLLESMDCHSDEVYQAFRDELRKIKKTRRNITSNMDRRTKSSPFWFHSKCKHCADNSKNVKKFDIFRADAQSIGVPNHDSLQKAVIDWLQNIHTNNSLEQFSLDQIISSLALKLRDLYFNFEDITKSEIIQIIEEVTFDASDSDRNVQLNNLVRALTNKIKNVINSNPLKYNRYCRPQKNNIKNKNYKGFPYKYLGQPTQEEVRECVREELLIFTDKFDLKLTSRIICYIETEVINILINSIKELQCGNNHKVKENILIILRELTTLPEYDLTCLANALIIRFKNLMCDCNTLNVERIGRQSFIVFQNTIQSTSVQSNGIADNSVEPVTEADLDTLIEKYTSQLTQSIEAWWTSVLGLDENEKGFKEVAINDLAGDIVDRHRFLDMNMSKQSSGEDEVDYLKFQIFRWINKLVGEEALQEALDRAPELMEQIQRIPVPNMRIPEGIIKSQIVESPQSPVPTPNKTLKGAPPIKPNNVNQLPLFAPPGRGGSFSESLKKREMTSRRLSEPAAYSLDPQTTANNATEMRILDLQEPGSSYKSPDIKITSDLQSYLNDWVNQIPIGEKNEELRDKIRRKIYNNVLKSLAKAEIESTTTRNDFYLKDYLEKELGELLSCLPFSSELASKKESLKAELIEYATKRPKMINVANNTSQLYKYRLCDAITSALPPRSLVDDDEKSKEYLFEEFLKLNIAEDFLLYQLYDDMNLPKAAIYKQKTLESMHKLQDNAELLPGSDGLTNLTPTKYAEYIYNAIKPVTVPPRHILQDEGDQIVIGHEISQWLESLPIEPCYDHLEQLHRRILRDSLAKKIYEIEKHTNLCDSSSIKQVKDELYKFLQQLSLPPEEASISLLIDEFINKLKNRREFVHAAVPFPWFYINVPLASTFVEHSHPIDIAGSMANDWGNLGRPRETDPPRDTAPTPGTPPYKEPTNAQWLTLLNTQEQLHRDRKAQALAAQAQQIPSCCQPAATTSLTPQPISGNHFNHTGETPYREPSNVKWLTLLDTQEQMERDKKAREGPAPPQQIPPCCWPDMSSGLTSQESANHYSYSRQTPYREPSNVKWLTLLNTQEQMERDKKPPESQAQAQIIPLCCQPVGSFGPLVVNYPIHDDPPSAGPQLNSEMRRLVDLQDQRLGIKHDAIPEATSFVEPPDLPVKQLPPANSILGSNQMQGSNEFPPEAALGPVGQNQLHFAAPLAQQEVGFATRHNIGDIREHNISRPMISPRDLSIQAPVGFSTPRQSQAGWGGAPEVIGAENIPGATRARRKRTRGESIHPEAARRRPDVEEVEEEEDKQRDEVQCRCTERVSRCRRRRPMCCDCQDIDYSRYPMPYPYCFF